MNSQYKDPWADTANQAIGALYKHYLTKPGPADFEAAQLENDLKRQQLLASQAQVRNADLEYQKGQFDLNTDRQTRKAADLFTSAYSNLPVVGSEIPLEEGQYGPNPAVTQQTRNSAIAGLFDQFAPTLDKDTVTASRDALGTAGALRFEDPIQQQLALDERASSYDNMIKGDRVMSPGQVLLGDDNKPIYSAPFKTGGGSYIEQPDGTIISIDGGQPPEMTKPVQTNLQEKDISFDTYRSFSQKFRQDINSNPGAVGTRGNLARLADGLLGQVEQFAPNSAAGGQLKTAVNALAGQYTDPATGQIMNQDLYAAASTAAILPFIAAEAIVGQGGRSLSNEDRDLVKVTVGGPEDWLATPDKLIAKMDNIDVLVENLRQKYQGRLMGQRPMTPAFGDDNLTLDNTTPSVIKPGTIEEGYRFLGGDPANPASWEPIQ